MGALVSTRFEEMRPPSTEEALADVLTANYPLTHAFYKVIHEARPGDVCLSPALLQLSLGALAAGATGTARKELCALLHSGGAETNQRHNARGHAALRDHLHSLKDVTIATALRIYTPDTMKLLKDWFVSSTKNFSVCIKPTNFIKSQDELLRTINNWVKSKTKNQISELIPPETIYSIIQLLSVCAAYFQCDLEYPFYAENTTNDLFYVNNCDTRPVKLMHQVNIFRYAELDNLKCQALEMPYKNPDLRLIVLLPFSADGLPSLERDFVHINFVELLENMIYAKVLVSIPSFKLQESYDICDYLDKIGLSSLMSSSERPFMKISEENPPASLTHFNHMLAFNFMEENKDHVRTGSKLTAIFTVLLTTITMSDTSGKHLSAVSASSQQFGLKLYKLLREKPGNVFFSPVSLEVVLALVHLGAKGKTAEEIISGLSLPKEVEAIKQGYQMIMTNLKSSDDMILEIANKIYSDKTFAVEKEFSLVAEKFFLADAEDLDIKANPDDARVTMNTWVEKQTRDKIKDLFAKGDISVDTRMVLINAVYFKGKWVHPFNPSRTSKEPFHVSATETKEVDMMHIKQKFGYLELEELNAKMLIMPYVGGKMFMVILLPNQIDGLAAMEEKLHSVDITALMKRAERPEVEVSLPRFKIEKTIDLKETLQKMGIKTMFDANTADFSGISKEKGLYVSKVIQKAFIEVNEEGSEAAAATGVVMMMRCAMIPLDPIRFKADHPFTFYLINKDTNNSIFQGQMAGL